MTTKTPTKRSIAIDVMNKTRDLPKEEVIRMISEAIDITLGNAKCYYRYIVKHGLSDVVATPKAAKPVKVKTPKVKAEKPAKVAKPKKVKANRFPVITAEGKTVMRTADEIAEAIERARLRERLKEEGATSFGAKFNYKTREFEEDISQTNEIDDLCALFNA